MTLRHGLRATYQPIDAAPRAVTVLCAPGQTRSVIVRDSDGRIYTVPVRRLHPIAEHANP